MTTDVLLYSGWSSEANNKPQYYEKTCYCNSEKGVNFNFAPIPVRNSETDYSCKTNGIETESSFTVGK